jgi:hypothetical protein
MCPDLGEPNYGKGKNRLRRPNESRRTARCLACIAIAATAFVLSACASSPQIYSSPQHKTLHLEPRSLDREGVAFLTPSTVTGQEEDKQTLAYIFASSMQSERPEIRFLSLPQTISAVNRAGLADAYRRMYQDYRDTGVFDVAVLRQVAQSAGVRYLAQLKLANMHQGARGRFSFLGLSVLQTHFANLRVFLQIWDSRDGSIAWEGLDEVTFATDTGEERPITFRKVAGHAAENLIKRLP